MSEIIIPGVGRWLDKRGILIHFVVPPDEAEAKSRQKPKTTVFDTMVTVGSNGSSGFVRGELIRWAHNGEIGYEVRINGVEGGEICDVAAFTVDDLGALEYVASCLRQQWEIILDAYPQYEFDGYVASRAVTR